MPTFSSVTHEFIMGLDKINSYLPAMISGLQAGDKKFQQHKTDLVGVPKNFSGLGANAFDLAVDRNVARSTQFQFKMHAMALATSQARTQIVAVNEKYDAELLLPPGFSGSGFDEALSHYGYTENGVLTSMRDAVLSGINNIGQLLNADIGMCSYWLDNERDTIINDIQAKHNKNIQQAQETYQTQTHNGQIDNPGLKTEMNNQISREDIYFGEAKTAIRGNLYNQIHNAITGWFHEVKLALNSYSNDIAMAAAINVVTVGELIWELQNAPGHPPLIIYQLPNGGLMVLIGNKSVNDNQVNQAIQQYITSHHLQGKDGKPVQITLMGYQSGGQTAQNLLSHNASNGQYHVENMVLVGCEFTMHQPPTDTNYELYVSPGDKKAGDNSDSLVPTNRYQWANLAANAAFNIRTGGPWMGIAATGVGQLFNVETNIAQDSANTANIDFASANSQDANSQPFFGHSGQLVNINYTNDLEANKHRLPTYKMAQAVPFEAGGEFSHRWTLDGPVGVTPHYDKSSYLNGTPIADPTATHKSEKPGGDPGSEMLKGPNPLSPPTHYTLQNGQLVPTS